MKTENKQFKAGKYYIGDPCYVFGTEENGSKSWSDILEDTDFFEKDTLTIGKKVFDILGGSTAYGDGAYQRRQHHQAQYHY